MNDILELLSYPFVIRAFISGSLISICAAILGVILVLKHYSLIGHGLSEVGFASLSISAAIGLPPMIVSAPVIILASFGILFISQKYKVGGDIAIAIASSAALALGVLINSIAGSNSSVYSWLFGSVLAISEFDLILSVFLSLIVIFIFIIFYNRLFLITYNEEYARSLGINAVFYQFMISILTAITVVLGMRIMGTLLISGIIILPAVSAKNISGGFLSLVISSAIISLISFITGLLISFMFNLPAGAGIILFNFLILLILKVYRKIK